MFGLRVPLVQSLGAADFDGVQAILYDSRLREPSQWLSKINRKGEIFELQTDQYPGPPTQLPSSDKDSNCFCSDCATDDTGYGTDSELYLSLQRNRLKDTINDFSDVDEVLNSSCVSSIDEQLKLGIGQQGFRKVEEDIDSLFQCDNLNREHIDLDFPDLHCDIPTSVDCFIDHADFDDRYSVLGAVSEHFDTMKSTEIIPQLPESTMKKCECEKTNNSSKLTSEIVMRLQPHRLPEGKLSTVELCEYLLGIVPGHFGSSQSISHGGQRKKDRKVKIRGLTPTGPATKYPEIKVGDCLVSLNNVDVTWDNLENVLKALQFQRQAKVVIKHPSKQKGSSSTEKKTKLTNSAKLVQLVSGSNGNIVSLEELIKGDWEPFYGAMYLSLDGVNSDNMQEKEDIVYQFPRVDNKVIASRGMFITLAGSVNDATDSTVHSTTLLVDDSPVHIVYHCEGQNLFVMSAPEKRFSLPSLTSLVKDLVRLLQVIHGSVHDAFTTPGNHTQLDCFFALLHRMCVTPGEGSTGTEIRQGTHGQTATILPLPNEIKTHCDRMLTEFESADFGDMSDSFYGCRRSYSVLGSCLFYKNYLLSNHLPRDDLVDFTTYLRYHSLLSMTTDQGVGQLVVWKEVYPTRQCQTVPEEQQFGYTEPLIARWFWLIVGYKNFIMCISLETGGCTKVVDGVSNPDPFLIDQARTVLMQLTAQNVHNISENSITNPISPHVIKPDSLLAPEFGRNDLLTRSLKKPTKTDAANFLTSLISGGDGAGKKLGDKRKDSMESDNSSESSGESLFKFSRKGRLFPETAELLHNISECREDMPVNTLRKLTVGVSNSLFHFQYVDNLEGVVISSQSEVGGVSQLNDNIYQNFLQASQKIKKTFDNARKVKEQMKGPKRRECGLDDSFVAVREEALMFACATTTGDKKAQPLCYWVVGRCLSRSMRREVYVCFHESTPQTVIELAFKSALGYLPL